VSASEETPVDAPAVEEPTVDGDGTETVHVPIKKKGSRKR
jgi:hypothetical protein